MPACLAKLRCRTLVDTNVLLLFQVCTLLLCAGPIEGCSAVLAVRVGCRSLICAVVVCAEEKKQVKKLGPFTKGKKTWKIGRLNEGNLGFVERY